jgi:hypothetical protein
MQLTVLSTEPFSVPTTHGGSSGATLPDEPATTSTTALLAAALRAKLGAGHVASDEVSDGERVLREAVGDLAAALQAADASQPLGDLPRATALTVLGSALEGANSLMVVYAGWDRSDDALVQLTRVRAAYAAARRVVSAAHAAEAPGDAHGGDAADSAAPTVAAAAREVDAQFTRALFLAGQVHAQRGEATASAALYEATLTRQVDEMLATNATAGDAASRAAGLRTWARHAQQLAAVGVARRWWRYAAYCLAAADTAVGQLLLPPLEAESSTAGGVAGASTAPPQVTPAAVNELQAASAAEWAGLYAALLQAARRRAQAAADGDSDATADDGDDEGEPPAARLLDDADYTTLAATSTGASSPMTAPAHVPGAPFLAYLRSAAPRVSAAAVVSYGPAALPLPAGAEGAPVVPPGRCASGLPSLPLPSAVTTFDAARALFKAASAAATRSLSFYVLDGFVSRHADLRCQTARLYHDVRVRWRPRGAGD